MKMDLILSIIFAITPADGLCYRVINSSITQEVFSSVRECSSCNKEKTLKVEIRQQKKININILMICYVR